MKPWGPTVEVYCCPSQVKAKRYWLALSTGILKNALHRSIMVKLLLSVGTNVSSVDRLETTW